jgi:hypothetical protein
MIVRQSGGQMLERDGHLRRGFCWDSGFLGCDAGEEDWARPGGTEDGWAQT